MNKKLKEMTLEEEQDFMNKINDDFNYFIDVAPFVELGDTSKGKHYKLRSQIHTGKFSIPEIIFELQYNLYRQQQRHPNKNIAKLVVSELELTKDISQDGFLPLRGLMIRMYYSE